MAQKTQVIYYDDLTGEQAEDVKSVSFMLDGKNFEIDLTKENHDALYEAMNPYIAAGRRASGKGGGARPARRSKSAARNEDTATIRQWAKDQGYDVSDRGRVPAEIREAYQKATK